MLALGSDAFEPLNGFTQLEFRARSELRHLPWHVSAFIKVLHGKTLMLDKEASVPIDK